MRFEKVVTAHEMARVEKLSLEEGFNAESYMLKAAEGIAEEVIKYSKKHHKSNKVTLLVGKGNNGGDALAIGVVLLKKGFDVLAFCIFGVKECSDLNQKQRENFLSSFGKIIQVKSTKDLTFLKGGIILDGLLGTGFSGKTEGLLAEVIDAANRSNEDILAVDIPSGVDGNTGSVKGSAIQAKQTYYLEFLKTGFFLEEGYNYTGELVKVDFGLPKKYEEMAMTTFHKLDIKSILHTLPKEKRSQHKYEKGYVLALAGSKNMPGAALLCTLAALRSGAGIVRLFYKEEMQEELSSSFKELLKTPISDQNFTSIFEEAKRAKSFILGPGSGKSDFFKKVLKEVLEKIDLPMILDADALEIFAKEITNYPKHLVLTPHKGEMAKCLDFKGNLNDLAFLGRVQKFVEEKKVVLVLKGAPTFVFAPNQLPIVLPVGDPGMATAGSGDVLSGIIGALLAKKLETLEAAIIGVYIHGLAGEQCAKEKSSYSLIASDLIEKLPEIFCMLTQEES